MYMKISYEKEIHLLNKKVTMSQLKTFIQGTFKNLPKEYSLTYLDGDGDQISLTFEEDVKTLYATSQEKFTKVFIVKTLEEKTEVVTEVEIVEEQKVEEKVETVESVPETIFEPVAEVKVESAQTSEEINHSEEKKNGCGFWGRFRGCRRSPQPEGEENKEHSKNPFHNSFRGFGGPFRGPFQGHHSEGPKGPFSHPPEFKGFPGFDFWKAKFDSAITNKIEELMPCIVNKVKNALEKKQETKVETNQEVSVHYGVRCDGCNVFPISGIRYKCVECADFDFCQTCVGNIEHNHDFLMMKKPRRGRGFPGFGHHSFPSFGGHHGHHGHGHHWGRPEHKIKKRLWKLSQIFGGEPTDYKEFVESTLDLNCEDLIKKYSTEKNVLPKEISQEKLERKARKLAHMTERPYESLLDIVRANPHTKCWQLSRIIRDSEVVNVPESVSVVIETQPCSLIESTVEEIPKIEKVEEEKKVEEPKRNRTRQDAVIEEINKLVFEVVGQSEAIAEFVKSNWKLGADKIVEMWFEQN